MTQQTHHIYKLDNGMTLVVEPMSAVQSAAFSFLVPAGSVYDAPQKNGTASILADMITRGAGKRNSFELSLALDSLGLNRSERTGAVHLGFSGATLGVNIPDSLRIYRDILREPHLPDNEFPAAQAGAIQALRSNEDEPRSKIMIELRKRTYHNPWGLPTEGSMEEVEKLSIDAVREHYQSRFNPNEIILGVAGAVDPEEIHKVVEECFGDWSSSKSEDVRDIKELDLPKHISHDSTQTHIGISYDSVPYTHPQYYNAWAAVGALSGGMSSRLFTKVREERGLCYSIGASLSGLPDRGSVLCYAGTTAERAQETLDVTLQELEALKDGIELKELDRSKVRAKSSLIMQQESTSARASSIARDWYHLKKINTLQDIRDKVEALTVESVQDYLDEFPAKDFTILTLGPEALEQTREL